MTSSTPESAHDPSNFTSPAGPKFQHPSVVQDGALDDVEVVRLGLLYGTQAGEVGPAMDAHERLVERLKRAEGEQDSAHRALLRETTKRLHLASALRGTLSYIGVDNDEALVDPTTPPVILNAVRALNPQPETEKER